jgi:hypothetical protein
MAGIESPIFTLHISSSCRVSATFGSFGAEVSARKATVCTFPAAFRGWADDCGSFVAGGTNCGPAAGVPSADGLAAPSELFAGAEVFADDEHPAKTIAANATQRNLSLSIENIGLTRFLDLRTLSTSRF